MAKKPEVVNETTLEMNELDMEVLAEDETMDVPELDQAPATDSVEAAKFIPYIVQLEVPALNVRKGPGMNFDIVNIISDASVKHTIIVESDGEGAGKWGKLKTGGWISLDYVK